MPKQLKKTKKKNRRNHQDFWKLFKKYLIKKGIFEPNGRQPYFIGKIKAGVKIDEIRHNLAEIGFNRTRVEWRDLGQIFSARLKDGKFQYHLRIFKDGEIRGHIELRPKYILRHITARTRQPCFAFFIILLNEYLDLN